MLDERDSEQLSGYSETTEEWHAHYCPICYCSWLHQDDLCEEPRFGTGPGSVFKCPTHEGRYDE